MVLTREFKVLVKARLQKDPAARRALLEEAIETLLAGDVDTGKTILRDYINATVGFEELGAAVGTPPKSLMRMFAPKGNPQARNLFAVLQYLQKRARVRVRVSSSLDRAGASTRVSA